MSGMMMYGKHGKDYVPTTSLWLVYGKELDSKNILPSMQIDAFYYDTKQNFKELKSENIKALLTHKIEVPTNGYYNVYAINELQDGEKSLYRVAKLEYLRASHGGENRYTSEIKKPLITDKTKIDLRRITNDKEDSFFYKHSVGDELLFEATFENKPLANATLNLTMQSGWSKTIRTDENGLAKFKIIRDYFPKSGEFDKRHKEEILLTLKHTPNINEEYILTYPLSFYPSQSDYLSKGYALLLLSLTLFLAGWIIYRFRRNRTKPFSEFRHEE
jgi:hypothetical protein